MAHTTITTWPETKKLRLPLKLKIVLAVMIFCALGGLVGLASTGKSKSPSSSGPQYVGFATLVVENYLSGQALDVPMAASLTPTLGRLSAVAAGTTGQETTTAPTKAQSDVQPLDVTAYSFYSGTDRSTGKGTFLETDTFLVELPGGSLQALDVVLDGTPKGPELASLPAIVPLPQPPPKTAPAGAPIAAQSLLQPISNNIQYRINQWASAYVADNTTMLYQVTGATTSRTFEGITGYSLIGNPTVTAATQDGPKIPKTMIVTIDLTLKSDVNPNVITQTSYDLLLTNLLDEYPNVVAWGPAGSGSTLIPFQNGS